MKIEDARVGVDVVFEVFSDQPAGRIARIDDERVWKASPTGKDVWSEASDYRPATAAESAALTRGFTAAGNFDHPSELATVLMALEDDADVVPAVAPVVGEPGKSWGLCREGMLAAVFADSRLWGFDDAASAFWGLSETGDDLCWLAGGLWYEGEVDGCDIVHNLPAGTRDEQLDLLAVTREWVKAKREQDAAATTAPEASEPTTDLPDGIYRVESGKAARVGDLPAAA